MRGMTARQRAIFTAMRFEGASYQDLAARYGLSVGEVQREFACAILRLSRAIHGRWWQRWWPW
nr:MULTISPECIES: sigma factor-like helix-turn-helix DNA-binding protein [unclassified Novosphingobium]